MKKLVEIQEVDDEGEGLTGLMGQIVTIFCSSYFYTGRLTEVNDKFVQLENPSIVYETGDFSTKSWKDAQRLPEKYWYVMTSHIESFGVLK